MYQEPITHKLDSCVCPVFSRAHITLLQESSLVLRLLRRLCDLEGRPMPIRYKKEKSVYDLMKIHTHTHTHTKTLDRKRSLCNESQEPINPVIGS